MVSVLRALGSTDKHGRCSDSSKLAADAYTESLYRSRCHLVPFGRSGDRGSEHPALRGLVYVSIGRRCLCRAGHCRCDCADALIAPISCRNRTFCDGQHTPRGHPIRNAEARHVDGRPEC
jgi:hypothetical protein